MGSFSVWHWLVVMFVVVLLFGTKKIPDLARSIGSGIKIFKKELNDEEEKLGERHVKTIDSGSDDCIKNNGMSGR